MVTCDDLMQNKLVIIVMLVISCCCLGEGRSTDTGDIGVVIERETVSSRLFLKWDYSWKFCQIHDFDTGETFGSHCEYACEAREYPPYFCPKGTVAKDIWYETKRIGLRSWKIRGTTPSFTTWRSPSNNHISGHETMGIEFKCVTSAYCVSESSAKIGPPPENYLSAIVSEKKQICAKDINGAILVTQMWESEFCIKFLSMHPMNNPNCEFCDPMGDAGNEGWEIDDDLKEDMKKLWRPCFESDEQWIYMLMYFWRRFGSCVFRDQSEYYRMALRLFTQKVSSKEKRQLISQKEVLEDDLCRQYIVVESSYCLIPYHIHRDWSHVEDLIKSYYPVNGDLNKEKFKNQIESDFLQVMS